MHMRIIVPPAGHVCHVFSAANSYRHTVMRGQEFFVSTFKLSKVAVHISYIFSLIGISGLNDCTWTTLRSLLSKFRGSGVDILKFSSHAQVRSPKITSEEVLDKAFLRSAGIWIIPGTTINWYPSKSLSVAGNISIESPSYRRLRYQSNTKPK